MIMELEQIQKIWNEQKGETMYAINESALHQSITRKKNAASKRMTIVELSLMAINTTTGIILLIDAVMDNESAWEYAFGIIMLLTVLFLAYFRKRRLQQEHTFDRTMLGELDHAVANSDSIIQIATLMIKYYLLPLGIFSITKMLVLGASLEKWLLFIGAYTLSFILVYYERKHCHIPRKEKLLKLRKKLQEGA